MWTSPPTMSLAQARFRQTGPRADLRWGAKVRQTAEGANDSRSVFYIKQGAQQVKQGPLPRGGQVLASRRGGQRLGEGSTTCGGRVTRP